MKDFSHYPIQKKKFTEAIIIFSSTQQKLIIEALELAEKYHAGQQRDGEQVIDGGYVIHCVRAALWLVQNGVMNVDSIIAALLHDTLEDTTLTPDSIKKKFGAEVLQLVQAVTRPRPENETEEAKTISKSKHSTIIRGANKSVRMLKTADQLDNLRSWQYHSANFFKFPRWIKEVETFTAPIARTVNQAAAEEMISIVTATKERII